MTVETEAARRHAHELLEQLGPDQTDAVLRLLEVMVEPDEEPLRLEDRNAVAASREYFCQNPAGGVPFEQVVADLGFTMDQIRDHKGR